MGLKYLRAESRSYQHSDNTDPDCSDPVAKHKRKPTRLTIRSICDRDQVARAHRVDSWGHQPVRGPGKDTSRVTRHEHNLVERTERSLASVDFYRELASRF